MVDIKEGNVHVKTAPTLAPSPVYFRIWDYMHSMNGECVRGLANLVPVCGHRLNERGSKGWWAWFFGMSLL